MDIDFLIKNEERLRPIKEYYNGIISYVCVFPDYYEYGLPNIGMQSIYRECYFHDGVIPDRYYLPKDFYKNKNITWEQKLKVNECDFLGITFSYEGLYLNLLKIFEMCNIPFKSDDRTDKHPIIVGGGPTVSYNLLPISKFCDLFVLGEGEKVIHKILNIYKEFKNSNRQKILKELSKIEGVYIPKIHKYQKVQQAFPVNINKYPAHSEFITKYSVYGEKTFSIEIRRGCNQKCRFCYMGTRLRPARTIEKDCLKKILDKGLEKTNIIKCFYEGLDTHIVEDYLSYIYKRGKKIRIGSQRLEKLSKKIIKLMAKSGQRKLTIAPECSERLRSVIGKSGIKNKDIILTIEKAMYYGIPDIGLYFILGIPNEEFSDINKLVDLTIEVREKMNNCGNKDGHLEIGINPLYPKPWTAFQYAKAHLPEEIEVKFDYFINKLKSKGYPVVISNGIVDEKVERRKIDENSIKSLIKIETTIGTTIIFSQPILSRGGEELAEVIEYVYKKGDSIIHWKKAMELYGIDYHKYFQEQDLDKEFSWEFQKCIISKEALKKEYEDGKRFLKTSPCDVQCAKCKNNCLDIRWL